MSGVTIAAMRKLTWLYAIGTLVVLGLLGYVVYQTPYINNRLSWRVDFALTYLRGLIDPVQKVPTALPQSQVTTHALPTLPTTSSPSSTPFSTITFTSTPLPSPTPLPGSASVPSPAWEKQDINNCGPAALTMYLRFYGWEGNQETISDVIKPYREDRNVNVEELAYFVRTNAGWLNFQYRVGGDLALLKEFLVAGIPVMIEESFYFEEPYWINDDLWAAHYLLLTGYDDETQTFVGQDSFHGSDQLIPYNTLDEYWQAFNRVIIIIYLPNQEETVRTILDSEWDPDVNRQHALEIAESETQADADNSFSWFNLGTNLTYFERYIEATDAYDKARELGLPQRMLRYQFGPFIAYFHTGQMDDLLALTEFALKVTPNAEEAHLWHGWAMYRKDKISEAIDDFQQALIANPNYQDAQYALDFAKDNP